MDLHLLGADGVFRAADAARHGLDSHALERLVRDGRCERVTRGWYAVRDDPRQPLGQERRHTRATIALGREFAGEPPSATTRCCSCAVCRPGAPISSPST
ncbi:type IV toxin-antitoxin system AbiEi family antitoxin domain-containing protein [Terrabacter koreensis]